MRDRYFDNAATTPVDPRVVDEMLPYFSEAFGNANSIHEPGRRAHAAVELARERIAQLVGADYPEQIIFTSGATEVNNWIAQSSGSIACSPFEHSSMLEAVKAKGGEVLSNDGYRLFPPEHDARTLAIMLVNNETGAILPAHPHGPTMFRDFTQAVGKIDLKEHAYDLGSFSAHKFYGPKGVGAIVTRSEFCLEPMMFGGEHENGLRAGTLNVPGIVGMGAAAAIALQEAENDRRRVEALRSLVLGALMKINDCQLNSPTDASPYIVSVSFLGIEGETLVIEADRAGFAISSGAACSSKSNEPSHVLMALGLDPGWIRGTIRISFGKYNTEASAANLAKELRKAVEKLRTMK